MSYDGKLLARAKNLLDNARRARETERTRRLNEVYSALPEIRRIDDEIRANMANAVKCAMLGNTDEISRARAHSRTLQSKRALTLVGGGFPADYTDESFACEKCRDTGYCCTEICSCLKALYNEEQKKELSALFKLGDETFDNFSLEWYDGIRRGEGGSTERDIMETVYETCVNYARKFGEKSKNLFFTGGTGLGKTFLAACIARVVAENGFSVVYDTAAAVFERFGEARFSRGDAEAHADVRRYLTCDLLILDDLGTELTNAFSVSALYEIINTRLCSGKKTLVTSNLTESELASRYSPQIASRITGEYHVLTFCGHDIRLQKKKLK